MKNLCSFILICSIMCNSLAFAEDSTSEVVKATVREELAKIRQLETDLEIAKKEFDDLNAKLVGAKARYENQLSYKFRNISAITVALAAIGFVHFRKKSKNYENIYSDSAVAGEIYSGIIGVIAGAVATLSILNLDSAEYDEATILVKNINNKISDKKSDLSKRKKFYCGKIKNSDSICL